MIDLTPSDQAALRRLAAAGIKGLAVGKDDLALSEAMRLEHHRFAVLAQNGCRIQAYATTRASLFAYRGAA